jgi:hypothetical protein
MINPITEIMRGIMEGQIAKHLADTGLKARTEESIPLYLSHGGRLQIMTWSTRRISLNVSTGPHD